MIVDTDSLSALADGHPSIERIFRDTPLVAIPVVVLGEYRFGILGSRKREEHERWLAILLVGATVLRIEEETTLWYAELRSELKQVGTPIPSNDVWIAALCRQHNLPLLSLDRHFDRVAGLRRISW